MENNLKIWRLHPQGVKIIPAEKTLNNTAHPQGVKFCHPFSAANSTGFWVFPPADIDVMWTGQSFKHNHVSHYSNTDATLVHSLVNHPDVEKFYPIEQGRNKYSWGSGEPNVMQIWTGCIFQTAPGWNLHIRSPINFPPQVCHVMEGTLETDWMHYDIWINVVFTEKYKWVNFRRDGWPPLAQIIPVKRKEEWSTSEEFIGRQTPEASQVLDFWVQYNHKKFCGDGKRPMDDTRTKDSTTYYKERQRILDRDTKLPKQEELKVIKKITPRFIKREK